MTNQVFLLTELVKRDFQGRYAGSLLGFLWSFVQPLWSLVLYTFVFSTVMKISPGLGARTDSFAIFLFAGLLPWMAIQEGVMRGATAITDNGTLVKKLSFPPALLVLAVVLAALLHQAIAAAVFVVILLLLGKATLGGLPLLVVAVPLQVALTVGLALFVGAVNVFFRDIPQILGMILNAWFYLTPIVYPLHLVPERYQGFVELNPLTALVELYRQTFLGGRISLAGVGGVGLLVVFAAVVLSAGLWLFSRLRPVFVDEI